MGSFQKVEELLGVLGWVHDPVVDADRIGPCLGGVVTARRGETDMGSQPVNRSCQVRLQRVRLQTGLGTELRQAGLSLEAVLELPRGEMGQTLGELVPQKRV